MIDLKSNKEAKCRLRIACEKAKRNLSTNSETTIFAAGLAQNKDFCEILTRDKFEDICDSIFMKLVPPMEIALADAKLDITKIDEILMVGGSSRIIKVQKIV